MEVVKHRQQPKQNTNPFPQKSKDKIKKLVTKAMTGFFSFGKNSRKPFISMSMDFLKIEKDGVVWFFISSYDFQHSKDHNIKLLFQGKAFSDFLLLEGSFSISRDLDKIQKLKKKFRLKEIDGLRLIKVVPDEIYCWDAKQKKVLALTNTDESKSPIVRKAKLG